MGVACCHGRVPPPPRRHHRIFAASYDLLTKAAEKGWVGQRRAELLARAHGVVVELGAGTGANLAHHPAAVTRLILTEPDRHMAKRLRTRAEAAATEPGHGPVEIEVVEATAEALPVEDGVADVVVATLTLCTVDDPAAVAAEVRRVLAPGGRLLLLEHVRSPDARRAHRQDRWERQWGFCAGGCHPNRDTVATLRDAGFDVEGVTPFHAKAPFIPDWVTGAALP